MDTTSKIDKLDEKIKQLKAQKQAIIAREKEKERKARTRRLIQIGAIIDSMGINDVELADKFKNYFETNQKSKTWLENFIKNNSKKEI